MITMACYFALLIHQSMPPRVPIALAADIHGAVRWIHAGEKEQPLRLRDRIAEADVLLAGQDGDVTITFIRSGKRFRLPPNAVARVQADTLVQVRGAPPRILPALDRRLLRGVKPDTAFSPQVAGYAVRGSGEGVPQHLMPAGTVRAGALRLQWQAAAPQTVSFVLRVSHNDDEIVRRVLPGSERTFTVEKDLLQPGQAYRWSVSAISGDTPVGSAAAAIRVLSAEEQAQVENIEKDVRDSLKARPADTIPLVALAQTYESLGMIEDAIRIYREMQSRHPSDTAALAAAEELERLKTTPLPQE